MNILKELSNKKLLILILLIALFLRLFRLNSLMPFIGDQAWFYISAKDMILTKEIPLVGITSSHTWLHQGPFWTYILAFIFLVTNFNPLAPGYFTAFFGAITVLLVYKVCLEMFSKRVGLISSLLYAVSPLAIIHSRMPYHTSLIPFFTLLLIYLIYLWISEKKKLFPYIILILSILYNLELAAVTLSFIVVLITVWGFIKKSAWSKQILEFKTILLSFLGFIVVMLPIIIYDFKNGFVQTIVFAGWFLYKIIKIFQGGVFDSSTSQTFAFLGEYAKRLIFLENIYFSLILLAFGLGFVLYNFCKMKVKINSYSIIFLFIFFPIISFLINKTPSEAYLPIIYPTIIIAVGVFFDWTMNLKKVRIISFAVICMLIIGNTVSLISKNFLMDRFPGYGFSFEERLAAAKYIVENSKGKEYNIIGKGDGSQFDSFTTNYKYLTWLMGKEASKKDEKLKFVIEENKEIKIKIFEKK